MNKNLILIVWSWLIISVLLEVVVGYDISSWVWNLRGAVEGLIALSAAVPLILVYMGLWTEHLSLKMFVTVSLFFCFDLLLIWSASLAH
jgi:hypothetical protein